MGEGGRRPDEGSPSETGRGPWGKKSQQHFLWTSIPNCGNCFTTKHKTMFGTFIKELRAKQRLGLREFCLEHGHDPSNWSKIEREVLSPPRDEETLRKWAKQLGLKPGSDDWHKFHDYAAVDAGRIPDHVMENEELLAKLPAFFRTLSGQKPSREDLEKLLKIIRSANRP